MKIIIAGSRHFNNYDDVVSAVVKSPFAGKITCVFCGCARGADRLGEQWAVENKIQVQYYEADWENNGKAAGVIRNGQMAKDADGLIALWDGESRGTADMIKRMRSKHLPVFIYNPDEQL